MAPRPLLLVTTTTTTTTTSITTSSRSRHGSMVAIQAGSMSKKWDSEELRKCGAIGTTQTHHHPNLRGEIHPVFANWADADTNPELHRELQQPLLLASRILEAAGIPWASDFLAQDIFAEGYAGRAPSCRCGFSHHFTSAAAAGGEDGVVVPQTIIRYHRASWATPDLKDEWLRVAAEDRLKKEVARAITWQLDAEMFHERGWVGYTCRHPRQHGMRLDELDRYETIKMWDRKCEGGDNDGREGKEKASRNLPILIAAEFPARLAALRREGRDHGEEYLLTAFMGAVTILHELGHAIYWKDRRTLTQDLREPFYGADLEMELGDSFVASLFGGWVPVPVRDVTAVQGESLTFADGIAWRQQLSWDFHRLRPKHRVHYSIPVNYVARLFSEECWADDPLRNLIQPQTLALARSDVGISAQVAVARESSSCQHATAAIPDFHFTGQGWKWNRLPGAKFRIPQYDGYLCPDMDLPIATDDVIVESMPLAPLQPSPIIKSANSSTRNSMMSFASSITSPKLEMFPKPPRRSVIRRIQHNPNNNHNNNNSNTVGKEKKSEQEYTTTISSTEKKKIMMTTTTKAKAPTPSRFVKLSKVEPDVLSPDRSEISLDELRNRLSRLLGVSFDELEEFFEASRCA